MGTKTAGLALVASLALALAACGSTQVTPSAGQLIRRVPGCHKPYTPYSGVAVQAAAEQECLTPSADVTVATFATASLERSWISAQEAGTCEAVQGHGWAALVLPSGSPCPASSAVVHALGGRIASG
jgi:hypothetical protein